jgi:hypothetical protein
MAQRIFTTEYLRPEEGPGIPLLNEGRYWKEEDYFQEWMFAAYRSGPEMERKMKSAARGRRAAWCVVPKRILRSKKAVLQK